MDTECEEPLIDISHAHTKSETQLIIEDKAVVGVVITEVPLTDSVQQSSNDITDDKQVALSRNRSSRRKLRVTSIVKDDDIEDEYNDDSFDNYDGEFEEDH
jgi:hypothetical protein